MVDHREMLHRFERVTRGVAARRQLAIEHAASGNVQFRPELDEATRRAANFFRLRDQGERGAIKAKQKHPDLAAAEAMWADLTLRAAIQVLLLGNVNVAEICERLSIHPSVLPSIEDLYFDVRPMLSSPYWIVAKIITLEADVGRDEVAAQMRVAYFGGPFAAKALADAKVRLPTERAQQLSDVALLLQAKFQQAVEMPLNSEQVVEFMKIFAEIRRDDQSLRLERDKLTFRMQRWTQRHEMTRARSDSVRDQSVSSEEEAVIMQNRSATESTVSTEAA